MATRQIAGFKKRELQIPTELLKTPHGTIVLVPKRRAESLLARSAWILPDGTGATYTKVTDPKAVPQSTSDDEDN